MKRKVCFLSAIFIFLLPHLVLSQDKNYDPVVNAAGVAVIDASWSGAFYMSRYVRNDYGNFTIQVKNTGTKTISAINWEYILKDSIRGGVLYDHLRFRTDDKEVRPGNTKKFSKNIEDYYTRDHITAEIRITRVEYKDGSVWVRPASK